MKTVLVFCLTTLICAVAWSQNADLSSRNITLRILDKKGRPAKNIIAQSLISGKGGITDRLGKFVFADISDNDTISIEITRNKQIKIPVTGMDSIVVMAKSSKLISYFDNQGQNVVVETTLLEKSNIINVEELLKRKSYSSLAELLRQEAPVSLVTGPTTIKSGTEPLVVLDGVDIGLLSEAENKVNVRSIKTIEVQKNGMGWGVRGTNGVIMIKTY